MFSHSIEAKAPVIAMPQNDSLSDRALVERALAGDKWAEEAIYLRYIGYVNALCTRLLRRESDTQDVVQDTFVDVLEQLDRLREPDKLRHWITRIAVHKAHRRFRRRRLFAVLGLRGNNLELVGSLQARPALSPELYAEIARLDRELLQLPDAIRACWVLRHVEGYELSEVAVLCGCSLATAKRRIAYAEKVLRAHVQLEENKDE